LTRAVLVSCATLLVLTGCGSSSHRPTPAVLLPGVGAGYRPAAASGPLSADALAAATALPKPTLAAYLRRAKLRSAGEKVWTSSGDGFVTDIVASFRSTGDATGLVTLAGTTLPGPATRAFSLPRLPDARGFLQTSDVAGTTMFCVFAFAPSGSEVFLVTRCTPYPQDTVTVSRLLAQQMARAG